MVIYNVLFKIFRKVCSIFHSLLILLYITSLIRFSISGYIDCVNRTYELVEETDKCPKVVDNTASPVYMSVSSLTIFANACTA